MQYLLGSFSHLNNITNNIWCGESVMEELEVNLAMLKEELVARVYRPGVIAAYFE